MADSEMTSSVAVTRGLRVEVRSELIEEQSDPASGRWVYGYRVVLTNEGDETVQLISRHWIINDANGLPQEVRGDGVIGQQPVLAPGERFEYGSFCPLNTSFGTMYGSYRMREDGGGEFDAEIAPFALGEPDAIH